MLARRTQRVVGCSYCSFHLCCSGRLASLAGNNEANTADIVLQPPRPTVETPAARRPGARLFARRRPFNGGTIRGIVGLLLLFNFFTLFPPSDGK